MTTWANSRGASQPRRPQTGIGLTLLPVFYAHGGFGDRPPSPGQTRFLNGLDGFGRLVERSRAVIAPCPKAGSASRRTRCGRSIPLRDDPDEALPGG